MKGAKLELNVQYATQHPWVPSRRRLAAWAAAALASQRSVRGAREITVRIVGRREGRDLNRRYRGKDEPTNVLSFPAPPAAPAVHRAQRNRPLGDLVICAPLVSREAREQNKAREAHWAHMIVHGTLHLLGYDHQRAAQARRMERREAAILARFGLPDPYRPDFRRRREAAKTGRRG